MNDLKSKWDDAAEKIDFDPMRAVRYGMALRYLKELPRNSTILEIGCGEGTGLVIMQKAGFYNLTGVEVSCERLKRASTKLNDVKLLEIFPDQPLPFESETFDCVVSLGVIEHVLIPDEFIMELTRVLKKSASAIIGSDCLTWNFLRYLGLYRSSQPIDRAFTLKRFYLMFKEKGNVVIHFDTFHMKSRKFVIGAMFLETLRLVINKILGIDFRKISDNEAEDSYVIASSISTRKINYSIWHCIIKRLANFVDDENIFLIKRIQ